MSEEFQPGITDNTSMSIEYGDITKYFSEEKGVIPFRSHPKAPESSGWSGPREVAAAEVSDLKVMCTWYDAGNADVKSAYKLPHHRTRDKYTVWRGVSAAMGALMGARGGVSIPDSDKRGVYNHLAKHYKEFDKEPPEFRDYSADELAEIFKDDTMAEVAHLERRYTRSYLLKSNDDGTERFRLTERKVDRDNEVVEPAGGVIDSYKDNPVVLWGHGRTGMMGGTQGSLAPVPIGRVVPESIKQTKTYLDGDIIFDENGLDPFAAMIGNKVHNGFLNTGSIGFIPLVVSEEPVLPKQTGRTYQKWELVEFSIVPIPSLRSATARREFDDLIDKCAEYDHPMDTCYVDVVENWLDAMTAPEGCDPIGERLKLEAAILELQLTLMRINQ